MKILIIATLISSMAFAAAATCDVHNSSSSVDQLVTLANNNLSVTREMAVEKDEEFLPQMVINFLCSTINVTNASTKDPFEKYMSTLKSMATKLKINIENYHQYTFANLDKISCVNKDTTSMRDKSTLLKYAIDSKNYRFIRGAIFIKENGKNICNPHIDFNRKEVIDGQEETLIQFIDKILDIDEMGDFYDFDSLKNIKLRIEGCLESK